jgi:dynein heavy chain
MKKCLMQAGASRINTTFLLVDTQIIHDKMLEDMNGVLNTGDIPNL